MIYLKGVTFFKSFSMKKLYFILLLGSMGMNAQGSLCSDPIIIASLPFTDTDDTANYLDSYDPQTDTHPICSTTTYGNYYHGGNDVIYSYTAPASGTIKVEIPNAIGWTGMFIYTDCANIGVTYAACATGVSAGARTIDNFAVTAGQTYFIFISSWPAPQTVTYTLNVTSLTLGVDDMAQHRDVRLYPNPVSDNLHIETGLSIKKATVYNVSGQRLEARMSGPELITDHLQSGFYILELATEDGRIVRKNFIKSAQ